jgi:lipopolysaccharide transport system ATP-binding protein
MSQLAIEVQGLGKRYQLGELKPFYQQMFERFRRGNAAMPTQYLWALNDLNFRIDTGEVVGIIGGNGAGKSTLLKILSRITYPTAGQLTIYGRVASLLEVGTGFHLELTGRENVYLNGAILGMTEREISRQFDEIVGFAGLETFIDTPIKRYSSGMNVRLGFAVAAHLQPEILMVDEVLAVGDLAFQERCLGKLESMNRSGRTVIFVSHNMGAILRLCERGIYLKNGRLIVDGPIEAVVNEYTQDVLQQGSRVVWLDATTAPGNHQVRLSELAVLNMAGEPASPAQIDEPLTVRLRFQTLEDNVKFRTLFNIKTQGVTAFPVIEPHEVIYTQCGVYEKTFEIPANLLAEGEYTFGISMFSSLGVKNRIVKEDGLISLNVYDPINGNSVRGDYGERLNGVMRPMLNIHTVFAPDLMIIN